MLRKFLSLAGPAAAVLVFTACAGPAQQPAASQGAAQQSGPKYGGVLNARQEIDHFDLDTTYLGTGPGNAEVLALVYESLLSFKTGPDVGFVEPIIEPGLAEKWEVSPDSTTFTFHLRPGLKFADLPPVNGRAVTSADVKWSYEYLSRTGQFKDQKLPEARHSYMFEGVESITAPDASTVVVKFKEPFAPFLNYAAHTYTPIMPHEIYDQDGDMKTRAVGTGPFQLDTAATQKGTRQVLKKNPTYWDPGKPYLDEIRGIIVPEMGSAAAAFQTKQLDWIGPRITPAIGNDIAKANPGATAFKYLAGSPVHLYMNTRKPPISDLRVRQAISMAIDRDEFIRVRSQGEGAWALAGAMLDTFSQDEIKQIVKYDPEGARKLLAEAGYPNGVDIPFEYPSDRPDEYVPDMELLQSQLKKVGINLVPKGIVWEEYSALKKRFGHVMNMTAKQLVADVDYYIYSVYHPKSRNNYDGADDPKLTALLEAQRREPDPAKRRELVREAVRYENTQVIAGLAVYYPSLFQFWQPYVQNVGPSFFMPGWPLRDAWLNK